MSSFLFDARNALPINKRITANTATTIVDATNGARFVAWFEVNEINGGTHNLTVDVYDGTNAVYLAHDEGSTWKTRPVSPYGSYQFTRGLVIPTGSLLRVTSSDASGYFHVNGIYALATQT